MNADLEKILKLWEKDSEVDQTEPGKELLNIPKLHSKYVSLLVEYNLKAKEYEYAYKKIKKVTEDQRADIYGVLSSDQKEKLKEIIGFGKKDSDDKSGKNDVMNKVKE